MNTRPRAQVKRTIADLIPKFMANRHGDIVQLRAGLENAHFSGLKSIGHRLKGAGTGYGFPEISELGAQIEQAALRADAQSIASIVDALEDYLNSVEIEVI